MACLKARTAKTGAGVSGGSIRVSSTVHVSMRHHKYRMNVSIPSASTSFPPVIHSNIFAKYVPD